jgi:hypothetical protein
MLQFWEGRLFGVGLLKKLVLKGEFKKALRKESLINELLTAVLLIV